MTPYHLALQAGHAIVDLNELRGAGPPEEPMAHHASPLLLRAAHVQQRARRTGLRPSAASEETPSRMIRSPHPLRTADETPPAGPRHRSPRPRRPLRCRPSPIQDFFQPAAPAATCVQPRVSSTCACRPASRAAANFERHRRRLTCAGSPTHRLALALREINLNPGATGSRDLGSVTSRSSHAEVDAGGGAASLAHTQAPTTAAPTTWSPWRSAPTPPAEIPAWHSRGTDAIRAAYAAWTPAPAPLSCSTPGHRVDRRRGSTPPATSSSR